MAGDVRLNRRLGVAVRRRRELGRLSVSEAARMAAISQAFWSQVEAGDRRPGLGTLVSMGAVLGCKVAALLRGVC